MHNRISFNQLAGWINLDESLDSSIEQTEMVNDYYNCLIECDDDKQAKRYCRTLLKWLIIPRKGVFFINTCSNQVKIPNEW